MSIEALKTMKQQLMACIQGQLGNLQKVDTHQLGQAIDMVKDLSEAIYYCTITESMEKTEKSEQTPVNNINYYTTTMSPESKMYPDYYRDMQRNKGYMYYSSGGGGSQSGNNGGNSSTSYYTEIPNINRDPRQGKSPMRRRMYMEGKETHNDPKSQLKELESYLQELSNDITEMIKDASPEQKTVLHQKMMNLANKIV